MNSTICRNRWKRGSIYDACTVFGGVRDSSQESLTGEFVSTNGEFCEIDCG